MSRVLVVDGTNNFIRNFTVIPTLDRNGNPNGGIIGMLGTIGYFVKICQPDKIIIVWDGAGGSKKRRAINKDYKGGRKPARLNRNFDFEKVDPEKNKIMQRIRLGEYLHDLPVVQVTIDDVEADDVIAYCIHKFKDDERIIASNDKDFFQLLDEKTLIFSPTKKIFLTKNSVFKEFLIYPQNFALARAIVGDQSDNLKGVRGIGFKNLLKYFPIFSGKEKIELETVFKICEEDPQRYKKFLEVKEVIIDNLKIMQLASPIIGFRSIQKIEESLQSELVYNATSFRKKLIEDAINNFSDTYLNSFRILEMKGHRNGDIKV